MARISSALKLKGFGSKTGAAKTTCTLVDCFGSVCVCVCVRVRVRVRVRSIKYTHSCVHFNRVYTNVQVLEGFVRDQPVAVQTVFSTGMRAALLFRWASVVLDCLG